MKYPAYTNYRECDSHHFNMIPSSWDMRKMRQAITIKKKVVGDRCSEYTLLSLTLEGIIPRDLENPKGKFPEEFNTYQQVDINDIVLCLFDVEETPRGVGISPFSGMVTGAYTVVEATDAFYGKYIYWFYYAFDQTKEFKPYYTGLRNVIRKDTLLNIPIPLPPLSTQNTIATFLDTETAKIDGLIKDYEELITLLQEKRQALISHAVTRGLSELVSPDDPEFGEWAKPVKFKDSGVEWLGEIPEEWEIIRFGHAVYIQEGQVDPTDEAYLNTILIAPNHIESGTGRLLLCESSVEQGAESGKYCCKSGDVIYSKIRPKLAKATIAPCDCLCSADMYPLSGMDNFISQYLLYFLLTSEFTDWAVLESERVAMPKINRESLSSVKIPKPQLIEQNAIGKFLNRELNEIDILKDETESAISLLKEHRSALITNAVTGKINVEALV